MNAEIVPLREGLFETPADGPPYLVGGRCTLCGAVRFPWRKVCVQCSSSGSVERLALSRRGVIYSFTIVRIASPGMQAPYAIGYVSLPEGVRIVALLGGELENLRIGQAVEFELTIFKEDRAGRQVLGYRFVPAPE